jgi:hypothetical protein
LNAGAGGVMATDFATLPRWISASLEIKEGRDPLGLQTTTQDRLMPLLLPGVLELSLRARYLSFHAFLLDEYRRRRLAADSTSLSTFIKRREWEFGLAVLACPHECGSVPVGADRLRPLMRHSPPPYDRGESVKSAFGGYGLYYRSPLADIGIVARAGTLLGDRPIPVDVLTESERATRVASTFRSAIETTQYFARWMLTNDPLPLDVLRDYAEVACLCQLPHLPDERAAVHDALFGSDLAVPDTTPTYPLAVAEPAADGNDADADAELLLEAYGGAIRQRRRSFAHYLSLIDAEPAVVDNESAYRETLWSPPTIRDEGQGLVAGQWSALIAKDVWQDALCSVWSNFCRAGLARTRDLSRGLTWAETEEVARRLVTGSPALDPDGSTADLARDLAENRLGLDGDVRPASMTLEALRRWTVSTDTASSGLIVLLELDRRAAAHEGHGWKLGTSVRSAWQPSVASVREALQAHLTSSATNTDTMWWLVERFVLQVHERIAYSKLPEFTFRFRWEEGLLRFFDHGIGRFPLASIRMRAFASLSNDLGLWDHDSEGTAALSPLGREFVAEVFG